MIPALLTSRQVNRDGDLDLAQRTSDLLTDYP